MKMNNLQLIIQPVTKSRLVVFKLLSFLAVMLMLSMNGVMGQVIIAQQDFETSPASPAWSYTNSGGSASSTNTGTPSSQRVRNGSRSYQFNNETGSLTFGDITTTGYTSVSIVVRISSISTNGTNGADGPDYVRLFTKLNSASFASNTEANADIAVNGNSNARWGYSNSGTSTSSGTNVVFSGTSGTNQGTIYSTLTITIPNGTNTVGLRINTLNNDATEVWCIDDVTITGTLAATNYYWGGTTSSYSGAWTTGTPWGTTSSSGATTAWGASNIDANFNANPGTVTIPSSISPAPSSVIINSAGTTTFNTAVATNGTLSAPITLTTGLTAAPVTGTNLTLSGIISGAGLLTVNGAGALTLSNANTNTGGVTLTNGTLNINNATALGTVASTLNINGGTIDNTSGSGITLTPAYPVTLGADLNFTGTGNLTFGTGTIALGASTRQITVNANTLTFGGILTGSVAAGSTALTKTGNGTLALATSSTYTGKTVINGGIVSGTGESIFGANPASSTADQITLNGGTIQATGSMNFSSNRGITLGASGGTFNAGSAISFSTANNLITGSGSLTKTGASTLTFNSTSANTYTGTTTINAGSIVTVQDNNLGTAPASPTPGNLTLNGGTLSATTGYTLNSNRGIALGASNGTIDVASAQILTYGGIIAGSGTLTKTSAGALALSGANTFASGLTITAGTIRLGADNTLANSLPITLNGGTLSTGATTGFNETTGTLNLNANSTIALGTGSHTLTFAASNGVTWAGTTLTITGWSGTAGSTGTGGKIFVGTDATGLTAAQLAKISFSGYSGTAIILNTGEIVPPTAPANDLCSNATTLTVGASATTGTLSLATTTAGNTFAYGSTNKDVWYTFTPTCTGSHTITLTFSTGPDIDIDLFTSASCPTTGTAGSVSHGSTTTETITTSLTANTKYYLRVIDWNGDASNFIVNVATPTLAVTTSAASPITTTGATLNGNVTTLCSNITEIGFVYSLTSTNSNPLNAGTGVTKVSVTSVEGAFSTSLSGLTTGTSYSYKAYAFDGTSYTYGSVQTFTPANTPVTLATYTFTGTACSATALAASGVGANYTVNNASVTGQTCNNNSGTSYSVGGSNWGTAFSLTRYIEVSIAPNSNYLLTLSNISFDYLRTSAGAQSLNVRSSLDGYASDLTTTKTVGTGSANASIDLTGFTNQSSTVTFRIYGWGGSSTGDLRLDNIVFTGSIAASASVTLSNSGLTQFTTQNITRGNTNVPVSRFQTVVAGNTSTLSSLSFTTPNNGVTNNYIGGTDINNFKLWYGTTTNFASATQIGTAQTSVNNNPTAGETVTFSSLAQSLPINTYYFWITADVLNTATSGKTLTINAPTLTLASGSTTGSIAATGTQTINATPTNYYLNGTNSVSAASSYWTGANGTGSQLSSLSTSDLYLNIGSVVSTTGDLTLSAGSKIIVNNGGNLTIASGNAITGTIDVENGGTLTLNSTSIPTLGTLGSTSTIIYGASGAQAVTTKNYGNLTLSGGNTKTISGAAAVSGALTINGTVLALGSNNLTPTSLTLDGLGTKNGSWGSTAGSATYKNASYFGAIGTGTVTPSSNTAATASFSNIATSQSINYGTATVSLSGKVASGSIYPTNGETVSVTINGVAQTTTTTSGDGSFSINYTTSTLPVSASPYTITYAYPGSANGFLKTASNETSTALTVNAATNNWVGGTGNWSSTSNWSLSRVPSALNDNIIINSGTPTIDADYIVGAGRTLTISGTGSLVINAGKSITIYGTADFGGKSVTLKSTAAASGSIGKITGTLTGATNVTVERFITGQSIRGRWRFLSSPVQGQTVANWMNSFYVTGPGDSIAANAVNGSTLGTTNTNGFHTNYANILYPSSTMSTDPKSVKTTSIRVYDETVTTGGIDGGWGNITTATTLDAGKGFRAYIRGDKNAVNAAQNQLGASANGNIQGSVNITLTGTPNQGEVNANPTFTSSGTLANDGWNLLGNPYPCSYDFVAHRNAGSSVFSNIDPTVYVYSGVTGGYVSFNALSNTNLNLDNGIIPAGAGFFVKANAANPVFKFKEAYKTTNNHVGTGVHKTAKTDEFGIKYYKDSTESDYIVVKPYQGATMNAENLDIIKVQNDNLNLSAYGADSILLSASLIPPVIEETRVKLNVEATAIGTYNFDFKNMDNFQSDITVHLFDRYTNKTIDVRKNTKYTFDMGPAINQWGKNRFELILNMDKTGVNEFNVLNKTQMLVYPNPATDVLNIDISNSSFKNSEIVVYNISGTEVIKTNMASNSVQLNIETLGAGVYFVKVSNQNGFNKTVKFVK